MEGKKNNVVEDKVYRSTTMLIILTAPYPTIPLFFISNLFRDKMPLIKDLIFLFLY